MDAIDILILIAMGAVILALGFGIFNLTRQGAKARTRSNRLMRLRIILQALAVVLILIGTWWKATNS
jgi:NADH:ubiquinone oxidoreductase subunit 6 (subunit J)